MSALDPAAIIGEVARRHRVLLSPDDPILVTVTLNEVIVARAAERVAELVNGAADQISAAAAQQQESARQSAEVLITGAAVYVAEQAQKAADELASRLRDAAAAEVARVEDAARRAERARLLAVYTAAGAGAALTLIVGLLLGTLVSR